MRHDTDILAVLEAGEELTLATLMPDGAPHATTVSYASDGLTIYFGCGPSSQKAQNLARDDRIAVTINLPHRDWGEIRGLSLQGRARRVADGSKLDAVTLLFFKKFSEIAQYAGELAGELAVFELELTNIAILDYRRGFGHVDYVSPAG
jgi:nitroimidazol reductase NimA-like FMN-containing flavoprotein (pyridoxamine 5'-phosphate oxidase superfamily)